MKIISRALLLLNFGWALILQAAPGDGLQTLNLTVDGVPRTALVYAPTRTAGAKQPLVFAFHGHGGSSPGAVATFAFDKRWPEAISVYPQGLDTPGMLTDPTGKRTGWQNAPGKQDDRDLHFFDVLLAELETRFPVDPKRVYVTGHSNGAGFTYLLWKTRPALLAAVAPCSGAAIYALDLTPKPAMVLGGSHDDIVKTEWQQRMAEVLKQVNGCEGPGGPWEGGKATLYPSKSGTPLVTYIYDGGHMMEPGESALIVKFFQQHPAPTSSQ